MFDDWITEDVHSVLLVEPNFPIPSKSRNHKNFLPIGLLKIAAYLRTKSIRVKLIRLDDDDLNLVDGLKVDDFKNLSDKLDDFQPDLICVTSIFTYWAKYVKNTVSYLRFKYNCVPILVGGIYASLMPNQCKEYTGCDEVIFGIVCGAEKVIPAYDLVDVDYQIIHTTRGCIRRCGGCGVYQIEPEWLCKKSIKDEIIMKKIIFYDNNILANKYIENILNELIELKKAHKISYVESQSGFDGRILRKKPELAKMLKKAGFKNPKIAWDGPYKSWKSIKKQIDILVDAGFNSKDISVFMLYNYDLDYDELESKRVKCFEWKVQITDCRFRPLDEIKDNYSPHKRNGQTNNDYFIHEKWTDAAIRKFRRNVRRNNICVRHDVDYHSSLLERKKIPQEKAKIFRESNYEEVKDKLPDAWSPAIFHDVDEQDYFKYVGGT
ncbi:cobalamin-dependent protein [Methanobrevibacter smithii]|uniref:cobalamin-dependent protein n=1 Tax=Methanobrevibacter smithii TaxID=2173 RepID=UPI0037DC08C7